MIFSFCLPAPAYSQSSCWRFLQPKTKWGRVVRNTVGVALALAGTYAGVEVANSKTPIVRLIGPSNTPLSLLRVALLGDSLSTSFSISVFPQMVWKTRTHQYRLGGWLMDTDSSPASTHSLAERLADNGNVEATNFARLGGYIDGANVPFSAYRKCVGKICNLTEMVDQVLAMEHFPNLVMTWIGHCNLDWRQDSQAGSLSAEKIEELSNQLVDRYMAQMNRLVSKAETLQQRTSLVVFGLVNFRAFFQARDAVEARIQANPNSYDFFQTAYAWFESMKPEYRAGVIALADAVNAKLKLAVAAQQNLPLGVHFVYSDALANADISHADDVSTTDGWHPSSPKGHTILADAAYKDLEPEIFWVRGE